MTAHFHAGNSFAYLPCLKYVNFAFIISTHQMASIRSPAHFAQRGIQLFREDRYLGEGEAEGRGGEGEAEEGEPRGGEGEAEGRGGERRGRGGERRGRGEEGEWRGRGGEGRRRGGGGGGGEKG